MSYPVGPGYAPYPPTFPMGPCPLQAPVLPPGSAMPRDHYQPSYTQVPYPQPMHGPQPYLPPLHAQPPSAPGEPVYPLQQALPSTPSKPRETSILAALGNLFSAIVNLFRRSERPVPPAAPVYPLPPSGPMPGMSQLPLPTSAQLSDEAYVFDLYRRILGREPDTEGLQHHLRSLRNGLGRHQLLQAFLTCPEYLQKFQPPQTPMPAPPPQPAPPAPMPENPPVPGSVNGVLADPRAYLFALLGVKEGESAENWQEVFQRSGLPAGPKKGEKIPPDAPFFGITQQINSAGEVRGRIFLPTDVPDEHGYYIHGIDLLEGEPLRWTWKDWLGGPPYAPRPTA